MAISDYPSVSGEVANWIAMDVADGVRPEDSVRVRYGKEELACLADVERDVREGGIRVLDIRE